MNQNSHKKLSTIWLCLFAILAAALSPLGGVTNVQAGVSTGVSEYYIPGGTDQLWSIFTDLDNDPVLVGSQGLHEVIAITISTDNTTIFYDHWENGYTFDRTTFTGEDELYSGNTGLVIELESSAVPIPRGTGLNVCTSTNPLGGTTACYDGRDRLYVVGGTATVTRAVWPESIGTVYAWAWELFPTKPYLTHYTIPVGENLASAPASYDDFDKVYVLVQSTTDNNPVQIDDPTTPATPDVNIVLDAGEVSELFHVNTGTTVDASYPVQSQFIVGQAHAGEASESRGLTSVPENLWDNEYYNPVAGFGISGDGNNHNVDIYIYNPNTTDITVSYADSSGTGSFVVSSSSTLSYSDGTGRFVPQNSGVYLSSSDLFWGIGSGDAEDYDYDWGFSLVPANSLTDEYFLGWAPGDNQASPTNNGSPAWITPVQDSTTVFVDYSPTDGSADLSFVIDRLEVTRVFDPDNENTGMHIWASGPIAVAWGEDGAASQITNPYLDMGYTTLPLLDDFVDIVLDFDKSVDPDVVSAQVGQVVTFTLVTSTDSFAVNDVDIEDILPPNWGYVDDSTVITFPDTSTVSGNPADPSIAGQILTWDIDVDMNPYEQLSIVFQAVTTGIPTQGFSRNEAATSGSMAGMTFTATDSALIYISNLRIDKTSSAGGYASPGQTITYTVVITNSGTSIENNVAVSDTLPVGTTYVPNSTWITFPSLSTDTYLDQFGAANYNNSNGTADWSGTSWVESGDDGSPATGQLRITGGELYFRGSAVSSAFSAQRATDLLGVNSAVLSFSYDEDGTLEAGDQVQVSVYDGTTWNDVLTLSNDFGGPHTFSQDITSWANANTQIRFGVVGFSGFNENFAVDNVQVQFESPGAPVTNPGGAPPDLVSASDGYNLGVGQRMTVTFQVVVDNPTPPGQSEIVNTVGVTTDRQRDPLEDTVRDELPRSSISDYVWMDLNSDGIQDPGEPGVSGVVVNLFDAGPDGQPGGGDDTAVGTTATDASGLYSFDNLLASSYYVEFVLPSGYGFTTQDAGGDDSLDSDPDTTTGHTGLYALVAGSSYPDVDAGLATSSLDYGDLPPGYGVSLLMDDGARHLVGSLTLGAGIDTDHDGQEDIIADGDTNEDGITRVNQGWKNNMVVDIVIDLQGSTGSGTSDVGVWIDWNNDGTFDPASDFLPFSGLTVGVTNTVQITVPDSLVYTVGDSLYVRVRAFDPASLPGGSLDAGEYLGLASNGEVEDYFWQFTPTNVRLTVIQASVLPISPNWLVIAGWALLLVLIFMAAIGRRLQN